jgi:hypothetical protein
MDLLVLWNKSFIELTPALSECACEVNWDAKTDADITASNTFIGVFTTTPQMHPIQRRHICAPIDVYGWLVERYAILA